MSKIYSSCTVSKINNIKYIEHIMNCDFISQLILDLGLEYTQSNKMYVNKASIPGQLSSIYGRDDLNESTGFQSKAIQQ